jgi:hypothetical protein
MDNLIIDHEEFDKRSKLIQETLIKAHNIPTEPITTIKLFYN